MGSSCEQSKSFGVSNIERTASACDAGHAINAASKTVVGVEGEQHVVGTPRLWCPPTAHIELWLTSTGTHLSTDWSWLSTSADHLHDPKQSITAMGTKPTTASRTLSYGSAIMVVDSERMNTTALVADALNMRQNMNEIVRHEASVVRTLDDAVNLGGILAKSGFFADSREAAQCVTKILAGQELGIGPVAAMTGIYIVKGRVTLSANLIGAAIKRSGRYNYRVTRMDNEGCTIEFYEHGEQIGVSTFDKQDAVAAGLAGGDNWRKFPRNMMWARAISNGAKWFTPDVFAGPVYTPDELGEQVDGETGEPIDVSPPPPVVIQPEPATLPIAERRAKTINAIKNLWVQEEASGGVSPEQAEEKQWPLEDYSNEGLGKLYRAVKARVDALPVQQQELAAA